MASSSADSSRGAASAATVLDGFPFYGGAIALMLVGMLADAAPCENLKSLALSKTTITSMVRNTDSSAKPIEAQWKTAFARRLSMRMSTFENPSATRVRCIAAVPEETASACFALES